MFEKKFAIITVFALIALILACESQSPTTAESDQRDPVVNWVIPESGAELTGEVLLAVSVTDAGGIAKVTFYRNGTSPSGWILPGHSDSLYSIRWDTRLVSDGNYILESRALDNASNLGISTSILVIVKNTTTPIQDKTPPTVQWLSPSPGATLKDSVTLEFDITDQSPIDSTVLYLNGIRHTKLSGFNREFRWNSKSVDDGVYSWEISAYDSVGNVGSGKSLLVKVMNGTSSGEDINPPVIQLLEPAPGSAVAGDAVIRYLIMDEADSTYETALIDGVETANLKIEKSGVNLEVVWNTLAYQDGSYQLSIHSIDEKVNIAWSSYSFRVYNHPPRVIWVPDEYAKIQSAIDASRDGDTVRVRTGTYHESLYMWDKNIWIESEEGPELTVIDASDSIGNWQGIWMEGNQDTTAMIRGFTIANTISIGLLLKGQSSPKIVNNIIINSGTSHLRTGINRSIIRNNVFANSKNEGLELWFCYGEVDNNILANTTGYAWWNSTVSFNPFSPDYNLIFQYGKYVDARGFEFGPHNILDQDPLFRVGGYQLQPDSPCIDAGRPDLRDLDGSPSDIGVYGGPYAYPPPE